LSNHQPIGLDWYNRGKKGSLGFLGNPEEGVTSNGILPITQGIPKLSTDLVTSTYPRVGGFDLPGHGEPKECCGNYESWVCNDVHNHPNGAKVVEVRRWSCGRLECPVCFEKVAGRHARRAEYRLRQFKHRRFKQIIHVIVSVSKSDYSLPYAKLNVKVVKVARFCGVVGGLKVFHPWRQKCFKCGNHPVENTKDKCPKCGSTFFNWYFSPHYHIVGLGWIHNVKENFEVTGWVVKNEGPRKTLVGTISYLLTHGGISKNRHSLTWFGCASYAKLRIDPQPKEGHHCIVCGELMVREPYEEMFDGLDPPNRPQIEGFYFIWE
jgi:hypothetical protein